MSNKGLEVLVEEAVWEHGVKSLDIEARGLGRRPMPCGTLGKPLHLAALGLFHHLSLFFHMTEPEANVIPQSKCNWEGLF